jgi:hypothetical protein
MLVVGFQNCSKFAVTFAGASSKSQSVDSLPFNHPDVTIAAQGAVVTGNIKIGDRDYLESVFTDVFASPKLTREEIGYLNAVLNQEFGTTQQLLGRSCDPIETGTADRCYGQLTNADTVMLANSTSIREAARIQVCRRLFANDSLLGVVIGKIQASETTPSAETVTAAIELFYPAQDSALGVLPALLNLDQQMAAASESVSDRWRLIFLTVCESPTWQVL